MLRIFVLFPCFSFLPLIAEQPQKAPRELIQYIEDVKRLGLKENEIRQNAVAAGWNKEMVNEALAIVRYLSETSLPVKSSSPGAAATGIAKPASEPDGYRIGAGDVLQILVWKEPEASAPSVVVRGDGKISVPLVREIEVAGLTPRELETLLTEKLAKLIRGVDVTVIVREINSRKVYLMGAVRKEGPLPMQASMTVLQAINAAGGLNEYAKRKKIYILRNEDGKQIKIPFNYETAIRGEKPEQNIPLRPDDMVVVP